MRFATTLLCSVTAATIALTVPVPTSNIALYPAAQAATNVSISIGTFYDDLAPYGSWVYYEDDYVFVPSHIPHYWRPYTIGHWVYTREFGWLWVSDEPFGWAVYHYGRWGYSDEIGWFWLPGRRWAPAWVSWRRSRGYVVWAPIPPRYSDDDFSAEIVISDIPDDYWICVPSRSFLSIDISVNIIDDDRDRLRVVHETEPVGNVTVQNNIVVNNSIDVDYVEKQTKQLVKPVAVKETNDPKQAGKGGGQSVAVFTGEVKEEKNLKPPKVKKLDEVKQERAKLEEQAPAEQGGKKKKKLQTEQQMTTPEEAQPQLGGEQPGKKKKLKATGQPTEEVQPQLGGEQPGKKKKLKATGQPTEEVQPQQGEEQPIKKKKLKATGQPTEETLPQGGEQPIKKKKLKATGQPTEEALPQGEEQPIKKKKQKVTGQPTEEAQPQQGGEQPIKKKRKAVEQPSETEAPAMKPKKGAPSKCDPVTGEGCQ
jgi:hypothetical protein